MEDNEQEEIENEQDIEKDIIGVEESRAKISLLLADTTNPEMLSELAPDKVIQVAVLKSLAEEYNSTLLAKFIRDYLLLQVSRNRKGREEIIEVATGGVVEKKKKGFFSWLKGGN